MKRALLQGIGALLPLIAFTSLISGCAGGDPINCTHESVTDLVIEIADDQVYGLVEIIDELKATVNEGEYLESREQALDAWERVTWELTYARPTAYDENLEIYSCAATLKMMISGYSERFGEQVGDDNEESQNIAYKAQVVDGQVLVEVFGLEQFTVINAVQTQREINQLMDLNY